MSNPELLAPDYLSTLLTELSARVSTSQKESEASNLHILFTMYGWADEGGGTIHPRQVARALVRRGHRVTVIYTAAQTRPDKSAYYVEDRWEEGVRLFGIFNRPVLFYDLEHPEREVDDPPMRQIVRRLIAVLRPAIVNYTSLLNFSFETVEEVSRAGIPSVYTPYNYWPICPRMYLFQDDLTLCSGPSPDGSKCGACIGRLDNQAAYARRTARGYQALSRHVNRHLAVSRRVRQLFVQNGYDAARIRVLYQPSETTDRIWEQVGARRQSEGPLARPIRVGFIGSLLPHKGVHVLVKALQTFRPGQVEGRIFGGGPQQYVNTLKQLDRRGMVRSHGGYGLEQLPDLLQQIDVVVVPSVWEDCAPFVVQEALAARVPVIGSRVGGIPEFIDEGATGFLFDPRDSAGLASVINRFLTDQTLLGRMQQAIAHPKEFDAYLDELIAHYREVIAESNSAAVAATPGSQKREPLTVMWEGSQFVHHSLALINRELCIRLAQERGVELSIIPYERHQFGPEADPRFEQIAGRLNRPLSRLADVHVRHQWPPNFTPPAEGHWVMIQPWEFGALPKQWVEVMREQVDEVWVPSNFVRDCYVRSGVPVDRVAVVPNGVDIRRFSLDAQPMTLPTQKRFKFLFVGGTIWRKGPDVLLESYLKTFTADDDVCLVIKDMGGDSVYKGQTLVKRIRQLQSDPRTPEILYLTSDLSPNDLPGLYAACNCLVHPYRGEGFGLPIAEAMACGIPVIVTGAGACLDFCDETTAYLIPAGRRDFSDNRLDQWETVGRPFVYEPDHEATARLMQQAFEDPAQARAVGERARQRIQQGFTWEHAAQRAMERLRALRKCPIRRMQAQLHPVPTVPIIQPRAARQSAPLSTVVVPNGHGLAPL